MATSVLACSACLRRAVQVAPRTSALLRGDPHQLATRHYATEAPAADAPQSIDVTPLDPAIAKQKKQERLQRIVNKEMVYLDDAWKLAQQVERRLGQNRFDEALLMTQRASKDKQVVVAWNHLINYLLENQQLNKAIKIYNEMKKRAQLPTVYTFSVMFRGLAKSEHPKLAVAEAVKQYNLLLNDARLQPNSTHLNAVLNVCAKAGDLDSMFLIADTANETTRHPTAYTYTTILNALRHYGAKGVEDMTDKEKEALSVKVINQAQGLWMEVMDKWRQGRLVIDEELVCAMGRMLLLSPRREQKRQVFDLLEQTMGIPNVVSETQAKLPADPDMKDIAITDKPKRVGKGRALYAVPRRNTLALVLTVLSASRATSMGIQYWDLMVRHYGIVPDADIWLRMFGMLKVSKASAHTATMIDSLPDRYVDPKPFRIAMETCVRDNFNIHVMKHAIKILDASIKRLKTPDLQTLRLFLRTTLVSHHQMRAKSEAGDLAGAKHDYGMQIADALARLWEPYKQVHYHYFKNTKPSSKVSEHILYNDKREVIALARLMVSAFNKVITEKMLPEEDLRPLRPIGAKINREIQLFFENRAEHEPKLRNKEKDSAVPESDGSEKMPAPGGEKEESMFSLWGKDYKAVGEYIWDTDRTEKDATRDKKKYDNRVKLRDERALETRKERQKERQYDWKVKKWDSKAPRKEKDTTSEL